MAHIKRGISLSDNLAQTLRNPSQTMDWSRTGTQHGVEKSMPAEGVNMHSISCIFKHVGSNGFARNAFTLGSKNVQLQSYCLFLEYKLFRLRNTTNVNNWSSNVESYFGISQMKHSIARHAYELPMIHILRKREWWLWLIYITCFLDNTKKY